MKSPLEHVFQLAAEALEKREAHEEDCTTDWSAIQSARASLVGTLTSTIPMRRSSVPTAAEIQQVNRDPRREHHVATFPEHDAAYRCTAQWKLRGFDARKRKLGPGVHAVYVQCRARRVAR